MITNTGTCRSRSAMLLPLAIFGGALAVAQSSTGINLNINVGNTDLNVSNALVLGQTGSVGPLGNAALVITSSSEPNVNGTIGTPTQVTMELAFNEVDTIAISFTDNDPNFPMGGTLAMSGTITGGTGAYAGASGSLDLTITKADGALWSTATTTGSGMVTVGSTTTPITLSNFQGWCCGWATRQAPNFSGPVSVSGNLGNGSGTITGYYYPTNSSDPSSSTLQVSGTVTINFSSADSLTLGFGYTSVGAQTTEPPSTFSGILAGGTGKYANANGGLNYSATSNGFSVSGTMTTSPGVVITEVKTVFGAPQIALNTWFEIRGQNLVPADTPSNGVDWSNAPDFANGQMPTQLGPVSVSFGGNLSPIPSYIYWYCSAATDPSCDEDQINVLAPPSLGLDNPSWVRLTVNNNGTPIAVAAPFRTGYSPAFLSFDALGHIAARHLDSSLMAPANLYPGASTPAQAGETVSLYGTGFGPVSNPIVAGSATQSGTMQAQLFCYVSGLSAQAVGALVSPGLYQINLTVPQGVPSGDNPVVCLYSFYSTSPGALIAVQ